METFSTRLADDIVQIRLPLPFALKIVNCYLVRDGDRWCIIDTGLHTRQSEKIWERAFAHFGISRGDVSRILLTHTHPDHYGMAGWLQQRLRPSGDGPVPPVLVSRQEFELAATIFKAGAGAVELMSEFFLACGIPEALSQNILEDVANLRRATAPHPTQAVFLQPNTDLRIGGRTFTILHTPGHSDGHMIFLDRESQLALSGDHVLLKITPNISLWPLTEPDPLGRYLRSLEQLDEAPVKTALPGHGPVISHWRSRLHELRAHHDERLDHMLAAVNGHATPFEVCTRVFDIAALTTHEIRFAVTETLAHLEYLALARSISKSENGVLRYSK